MEYFLLQAKYLPLPVFFTVVISITSPMLLELYLVPSPNKFLTTHVRKYDGFVLFVFQDSAEILGRPAWISLP